MELELQDLLEALVPLVRLEPRALLEILDPRDSLETLETWDPVANQEHRVARAHLEHVVIPVLVDHLARQVRQDHLVQADHAETQGLMVPQAFREIRDLQETQVSLKFIIRYLVIHYLYCRLYLHR